MTHPTSDSESARAALLALRAEIAKAVVGQDAVVSGLVIALLCRGHVLLEGVPGVAKTLLIRTLAAALQLDFKRVQFTPDLMPGDVTGSLVYDARTAAFEFRAGPVFTNLMLADEINRTPPKTQAALLEAMEERQVSVDGDPRPLPDPFIVAATQNPIEYEGTYQLPEAQLDRFLLKLNVPLPPRDQEIAILGRHAHGFDPRDLSAIRPVAGAADLAAGRDAVRRVLVADEVLGYIVDVVGRHASLCGAATRGVTARRDGTAGHRAVVGVAVGSRLRHARRCQGDGQADIAAPHCIAAGSRTRGRHRGRRARRHPGRRSGAAVVILTGRTGLVALLCVLPIAVSPWPATAFAALLVALAVAVMIDVALAANPRAAMLTRTGDTSARLGRIRRRHPARVTTAGAVGCADVSATPGHPAPGPTHARIRWTSRRVNRSGSCTLLRPVRRGEQVSAVVTVRAVGPLGLAGRQRSHRVPWSDPRPAAIPVPQAPARRGWRNCARSTACCRR